MGEKKYYGLDSLSKQVSYSSSIERQYANQHPILFPQLSIVLSYVLALPRKRNYLSLRFDDTFRSNRVFDEYAKRVDSNEMNCCYTSLTMLNIIFFIFLLNFGIILFANFSRLALPSIDFFAHTLLILNYNTQ